MKKIALILSSFMFFFNFLSAQVYATEQLRQQEEQHVLEKNKRLGISDSKPEKEITETKKPLLLPQDTYKLLSIKALDYSNKHSEAEMKAFQQEMKDEFATNDIQIANDFSMFYVINRTDNSKYLAKKIKKENNKLVYLDCEKCNMNNMTIITNNNNELILETAAQDSDSFYTVRFTLKK